jgi:DNA-binding transcriptional ArsR family regulator
MTPPKPSSRATSSGRSYTSEVVKAAAHPTRQGILKALEKDTRTTVELEEITGENRYHLYHHLSVLEGAGLVASRIVGKAKEFSLRKPKKPEAVYLQLDGDDPEEGKKLETLLKVVREITDDGLPHLEKVTRARLMLSYPWSPEEED